jgi:hypothetical protein
VDVPVHSGDVIGQGGDVRRGRKVGTSPVEGSPLTHKVFKHMGLNVSDNQNYLLENLHFAVQQHNDNTG